MPKNDEPIGNAKPRKLSALERVLSQAIGDGQKFGRDEDPARVNWPNLWAWLTTIYVGRDSLKSPAVLTIRMGPEGAIASLTDRDLAVALDASSATLEGIFAEVERLLASETPPIRVWGKREPTVRRRKSGN
jgi:hypothetical protein